MYTKVMHKSVKNCNAENTHFEFMEDNCVKYTKEFDKHVIKANCIKYNEPMLVDEKNALTSTHAYMHSLQKDCSKNT